MTVTYSSEVANGSSFGCFWRILCKWRGSVYKLVWRELFAFLTLYFTINLVYRLALSDDQKRFFERVRFYFKSHSENIPMSFVLGFYVTLVVGRWWQQYKLLPWPDTLALFVSAAIPGADEKGRLMRRNIVRYAVLAYVITLQRVSLRVKKRFPGWQHMVDAGLMMESEKKIFDLMDEKNKAMSKYWMPLVWATNIINRARKESLISSDHLVQTMLTELSDIRRRLGSLIGFDTVCVPLVYTQVVTLSVYSYFISALLGRQFIPDDSFTKGKTEDPDFYFPIFTCLQFIFYVGWLKVAEVLINPFGEDDDDIELNWLIDRHIKAAYMIVDQMHEEYPELLKDQYWEEVVPKDLPYTVASECYRRTEPKGSAEHYKVKENEAIYSNLQTSRKLIHPDDVYGDHPDLEYETVDTPMVGRKNWFQRQMHRMGSLRSTSTSYASGRLFSSRHNSVFSNSEAGLPLPLSTNTADSNAHIQMQNQKMSLYDRLLGRKSSRGPQRRGSKMNPSIPVNLRNRPRIPTPDVTKEVMAQEQRMHQPHSIPGYAEMSTANTVSSSVSIAPAVNSHHHHHLITNTQTQPPVVQVLLSPIQETEVGPCSALAQAVLTPALNTAGLKTTTGVNVGAVTLAGVPVNGQSFMTPYLITTPAGSPSPTRATFAISPVVRKHTPPKAILSFNPEPISIASNEIPSTADDEGCHGSNTNSIASNSSTSTVSTLAMADDPTRKLSVNSQTSNSNAADKKEVYV